MKALFQIESNQEKASEFFETIKGRNLHDMSNRLIFEVDISEDQVEVIEEHLVKMNINYSVFSWTSHLLEDLVGRLPDLENDLEFQIDFQAPPDEHGKKSAKKVVDSVIDGWIEALKNLQSK